MLAVDTMVMHSYAAGASALGLMRSAKAMRKPEPGVWRAVDGGAAVFCAAVPATLEVIKNNSYQLESIAFGPI